MVGKKVWKDERRGNAKKGCVCIGRYCKKYVRER
jgi:hypothetical protein